MSQFGFNVADGSVATVLKEGSPLALIKGYQADTWFYAPRAPRIARSQSGRPQVVVVRNREHLPGGGGFKTLGGVLAVQLDLTVPELAISEQAAWAEQVTLVSGLRPKGNHFHFQPLRLRSGRMSVLGMGAYAANAAHLQNVVVGASATLPISVELNERGADTFAAAMGSGSAAHLPLVVFIQYKYDMILPNTHYKLHADTRKSYKFFSENVKARATWWGLVGANADIQNTREQLVASGALTIEVVSPAAGLNNDQIAKLQASLIDAWAKTALAQIAEKPSVNPAAAPDPSGFFGGVSVALKAYDQVQNLSLSVEYKYSELVETDFSLSYVLAPEFDKLNAHDFVVDVVDDNQLPIVINIGGDPRVRRYTGQFGYKKPDGTFVANSLSDIRGADGSVLTGTIQFGKDEQAPPLTSVKLSVDWLDPDWEDRHEEHSIENNEAGALDTYSPGNSIASVMLITDLEKLAIGTTTILTWESAYTARVDPPTKKYSGYLLLMGAGESGTVKTKEITFPYVGRMQDNVQIRWRATINAPGGPGKVVEGSVQVTVGAFGVFRSEFHV